jgi:hypothetical protein
MHALHVLHALPDLRVGSLRDGVDSPTTYDIEAAVT